MRPPRGITGFAPTRAPVPEPAALRGFGHHAACELGGRVCRFVSAGVTPSFHRVELLLPGGPVDLLGHAAVPWLAFAEPGTTTFRDVLVSTHAPWTVLGPAGLATPLERLDLTDLDDAELRQIHVWRPETLGELAFHFWD